MRSGTMRTRCKKDYRCSFWRRYVSITALLEGVFSVGRGEGLPAFMNFVHVLPMYS